MTRSIFILLNSLSLLLFTDACSKPVQNPRAESASVSTGSPAGVRITSESVVKVEAQPVEIPSGGSGEATVRVTVQRGYHINANPPTFSYLKATVLEIAPAAGVAVSSVLYPAPVNKKFAFAEKPLSVYEGETELKATLKADKSAKSGARSVSAKLRIQACDDQVCYPPGTIDLAIPVSIK